MESDSEPRKFFEAPRGPQKSHFWVQTAWMNDSAGVEGDQQQQHTLWQFDTRRRFIRSLVTAAVSDEHRRSAHLFLVKVPAHHSAPSSAALAEGSRVDCIQTTSPHVQESTRVSTCIPYWQALSGGRRRGSSATLFQFILIIDCQPHPTPCRWPSFPGRRCTCLEQYARSCHFCTFHSSLPVPA